MGAKISNFQEAIERFYNLQETEYMNITFKTKRLHLRPVTSEDAPFILELLNTPKWFQYIGDRKVYSVKDASNYITEKMTPQMERLGFGNFLMIRQSDQKKIGTCGLYDREGMEGVDIGFALLPAYENQGFGTEAAKEMVRAAWEDFGLTKISGITTKENVASQRLLEKLGLKYKGTVQLPDDEEVLWLYELEKDI